MRRTEPCEAQNTGDPTHCDMEEGGGETEGKGRNWLRTHLKCILHMQGNSKWSWMYERQPSNRDEGWKLSLETHQTTSYI